MNIQTVIHWSLVQKRVCFNGRDIRVTEHVHRDRAHREGDNKTRIASRGPGINTPSHNTFFLLRHFGGSSPGQSGRIEETRCDDQLWQKGRSGCEKGVRSTVDWSDWLRTGLDTGKSGNVELMTRSVGWWIDGWMAGRIGKRR